MPRAKRKAKPTQDFVKKKTKLGKKARSDNYTDTRVRQRQIYVPNQTRQTSETTGLSLSELISRTKHHNHNTRITSFNALTNALTDSNATAHTAVKTPASVVIAACQGLSDEVPQVRSAASDLLFGVLEAVDCAPFKESLTAMLMAGLTHIRTDIRVDVAKTLTRLSERNSSMLVESPLEALSDLLTTPLPRAKHAALSAIAVLSRRRPLNSKQSYKGRFFYHRESSIATEENFLDGLSELELSKLVIRVAEAVIEHLHQSPRSLSTSCIALAEVLRNGIPKDSRKIVERVLSNWRYTGETYPLAKVALSAGREGLVSEYLVKMLERGYNEALDAAVRDCLHLSDVSRALGRRFERAVMEKDAAFVRKCCRTIVVVMQGSEVSHVVGLVPLAIKVLSKGDEDMACDLVKAACSAWKAHIYTKDTAAQLLSICTSPLVTRVIDEVAGVAICAGLLTSDVCVGMLGECIRQGKTEVVEKFLQALEWEAGRADDERLQAVALARALGQIGGDNIRECANRVEGVTV